MLDVLALQNSRLPSPVPLDEIERIIDRALGAEEAEQAQNDARRRALLWELRAKIDGPEKRRVLGLTQHGTDERASWTWDVQHRVTGEPVTLGPFSTEAMIAWTKVRAAFQRQADWACRHLRSGTNGHDEYWALVAGAKTVADAATTPWRWLKIELRDFTDDSREQRRMHANYSPAYDAEAWEAQEGEDARAFARRHYEDTKERHLRSAPQDLPGRAGGRSPTCRTRSAPRPPVRARERPVPVRRGPQAGDEVLGHLRAGARGPAGARVPGRHDRDAREADQRQRQGHEPLLGRVPGGLRPRRRRRRGGVIALPPLTATRVLRIDPLHPLHTNTD